MRHDWRTPFLRSLLFFLGLALAVVVGNRLLHTGERPVVGYPAPTWELKDLQGHPVKLEDFRPRPVLVNFWAVWCPPCRAEMPLLDCLARQRTDVGVVALDVGDRAQEIRAFLAAQGLTLPVALDTQGAVATRYDVHGLPTTFFLDAQGNIRFVHIGALDEATLRQGLTAAGVAP